MAYEGFCRGWQASGLPPLPEWGKLAEEEQILWAQAALAVCQTLTACLGEVCREVADGTGKSGDQRPRRDDLGQLISRALLDSVAAHRLF